MRWRIAMTAQTGDTLYAITGSDGAWVFSLDPLHATSFAHYHHAALRIRDYADRANRMMWVEPGYTEGE